MMAKNLFSKTACASASVVSPSSLDNLTSPTVSTSIINETNIRNVPTSTDTTITPLPDKTGISLPHKVHVTEILVPAQIGTQANGIDCNSISSPASLASDSRTYATPSSSRSVKPSVSTYISDLNSNSLHNSDSKVGCSTSFIESNYLSSNPNPYPQTPNPFPYNYNQSTISYPQPSYPYFNQPRCPPFYPSMPYMFSAPPPLPVTAHDIHQPLTTNDNDTNVASPISPSASTELDVENVNSISSIISSSYSALDDQSDIIDIGDREPSESYTSCKTCLTRAIEIKDLKVEVRDLKRKLDCGKKPMKVL